MRITMCALALLSLSAAARADGGDPQVKTDHPWYPGELSCSTFERLFDTQEKLYERVTGRKVVTDEDKAIASWYWRNLNFAHGEDGKGVYFDKKFGDEWNREYWHGLFAHGFALCGTTHSQWTAEMEKRLGPGRGRVVGVTGHNSFEVYLTGGAYGPGRWALLDHDISTIIYSRDGKRLLSIPEIKSDLATLANPGFKPGRQRGWLVAGLHPKDASAYASYRVAEYNSGYSAVPPMVHLRAGESLRRYLKPGLEDGKTFVYWGRNYKAKGIPGPERSRTWVNQPGKMFKSTGGSGWVPGMVRFANAVYTYTPDFRSGGYREGVIDEGDKHVTFEFYSPYVIASTPAGNGTWDIYKEGGTNGLVLKGDFSCGVKVSTDQGRTWENGPGRDLTDLVKGHQQYWIRFEAGPGDLARSGLEMRTVCQCNVATIPRLRDDRNKITFLASGRAHVSAGPNRDQAAAHVVDGSIGSKKVTLKLRTPRGERAVHLYASSWQASGSPPRPGVKYQIEYSADDGRTWKPVVKDWRIIRRGDEPGDFWSQSICSADVALKGVTGPVLVRYHNDGGKTYRKVEAHLVYEVRRRGPVKVTFAWRSGGGALKTRSHEYGTTSGREDTSWSFSAGRQVETVWVEYRAR